MGRREYAACVVGVLGACNQAMITDRLVALTGG
jgi:hypothetical protein